MEPDYCPPVGLLGGGSAPSPPGAPGSYSTEQEPMTINTLGLKNCFGRLILHYVNNSE